MQKSSPKTLVSQIRSKILGSGATTMFQHQ